MRQCITCKWCLGITDSLDRSLYICVDANSGAYMNETGLCGNCDLEEEENLEVDTFPDET